MKKKRSIFLADDNPAEVVLLGQGFAECGVEVDVSHSMDGEDAAEQLIHARDHYDMAVIDYYLPKRTGGEVIQALVTARAFPICPVVILTTQLRQELRVAAMNAGVRAILDKPRDLEGYNKLALQLLQLMDGV